MADYNRYGHGSYSSSSSPYGGGYGQGGGGAYPPPPQTSGGFGYGQGGGGAYPPPPQASGGFGYGNGQGGGGAYPPPPQASGGFGYGYGGGGGGYLAFPPGTHPEVERAFRAADRDCSGAIDERELQGALSSAYHRFSIRTVRLLMFLFNDPATSTPSTMGPAEFVTLWNILGQWRGIFDRYDRDRSGKIDSRELTEALRSLGYAVPPSVVELLIANYNDGVPRNGALDFDNFVECGMVVKGLTDKFKEKDTRYTGSATLSYDGFLSMVIPFIVP
jgi:calcium-binding protein CML